MLPLPEEPVPLLLVSGKQWDRSSLEQALAGTNWCLQAARSCRHALRMLRQDCAPVVICTTELADGDWQLLLQELRSLPAPPTLIVSSRLADDLLWAEVLNLGGYDVLQTPFDRSEVLRVCFQAWKYWQREFTPRMLAAR